MIRQRFVVPARCGLLADIVFNLMCSGQCATTVEELLEQLKVAVEFLEPMDRDVDIREFDIFRMHHFDKQSQEKYASWLRPALESGDGT